MITRPGAAAVSALPELAEPVRVAADTPVTEIQEEITAWVAAGPGAARLWKWDARGEVPSRPPSMPVAGTHPG
jgi:hypothetical protein